jgi:hypothetical protein
MVHKSRRLVTDAIKRPIPDEPIYIKQKRVG